MAEDTPSAYSPSPRPTYDAPTLIRRADMKRHIWGDRQSGLVADWLYASTDKLHVIEFGLAPGKWFRHSPAFRTIFAADEVLHVLSGRMLACNPATGEVQECCAGEAVFFRRDTWHHVRAEGSEPLRVLEFFSPPPSQGAAGTYAQAQPYVEKPLYKRDELLGKSPVASAKATLRRIGARERTLRLEAEIAVGILVSTEHLTVAQLDVPSGATGDKIAHGGDAVLVGLTGELMVRTHFGGVTATHELAPQDAVFVPLGAAYEVLSFSTPASAMLGVAPKYLP